jgi:two-component system OmpR family response regulator
VQNTHKTLPNLALHKNEYVVSWISVIYKIMSELARFDMSTNGHILVVDDDPEIGIALEEYLSHEGYQVSVAHNGSEMRRIIQEAPVDLIIMDVMLPREDGLSLVRSLRAENSGVAILMLTGRGEIIDRVVGLEMGADDYLGKPFHLRELFARVKSVMRRAALSAVDTPPPSLLQARFAGWHINCGARELLSPAGENVRLTSGEFDILAAFIANPNQVLSRDRLLDAARNRQATPFDRTIDVQIGRLRRKLGDDPRNPQLIKTVRGGGYIFTAPVKAGTAPLRALDPDRGGGCADTSANYTSPPDNSAGTPDSNPKETG